MDFWNLRYYRLKILMKHSNYLHIRKLFINLVTSI